MLKCPNCADELIEQSMYGILIDRCKGCGGIFFDRNELESILDIVEIIGDIELDEDEIDTTSIAERERIFKCPHDGEIMGKKIIGAETIDVCGKCGGIWLDDGELFALKITENNIKNNLNLYIRLGN